MRTKILLAAAAAMAAGVVASNAQVYSQNVVGYINVTSAGGKYTLMCNPLDNGTNTLESLLPGLPTTSHALVWNGSGYTGSTKTPTSWTPNLTITPGEGFFVQPTGSATVTNTFVGSVVCPSGGSVTNTLNGGSYNLVGSPIPFADTLAGTNMNLALPTTSHVLIWNGSGYTGSTKTPTGFTPNPTITPGEGFFVQPTGTTPIQWVQSLPQ